MSTSGPSSVKCWHFSWGTPNLHMCEILCVVCFVVRPTVQIWNFLFPLCFLYMQQFIWVSLALVPFWIIWHHLANSDKHLYQIAFLGWLFDRVGLVKPVSNVRSSFRPCVRPCVRPSIHKKFLRFQWNLACR